LHEVPRIPAPPRNGQRPVIGVLGNIGYQKGAGVLAALSQDLAASGQADLVVIGNMDPAYALRAPAQVHGSYRLSDLPGLVARYRIRCWLIPSIWPETFSYATHEALATGLPVWCFDLGAQAEAVTAALHRGAPGGILPLKDGRPDPTRLAQMIHSLSAVDAGHVKEDT
jgi:glycosyltransferase involved in cell wall biosynthesis